jgi:pimeloyl-ACP methyl ester carboxylesterase
VPFVTPPPLPSFLLPELPFERRAYRLEGIGPDAGRVMHLIDHGARDGRPVLFCHGNPTWSFLWRKVIARLDPASFRCVAPDLLGFGLSSKLNRVRDHTLERHLEALCELVTALDLGEGVILVGQDWGGPLVVGAGARALRDQVAGVVLGNTSVLVPRNPRGTWFHRFANTPLISDLAFRVLGFPQDNLGRAQGDKASMRGLPGRAYRWPLESLLARSGPLGMARMVPSRPDHPSLPALREIEAWILAFEGPMALVWGERDPVLGRALKRHVRELHRATVTRTDAGHFLQEEVPGPLAAAIRQVSLEAAPAPANEDA